MRIDHNGRHWTAEVMGDAEKQELRELGGWKWHSGACDARFCRAGCPAEGHKGWWTASAAAARRVAGAGVHSDASRRALEAGAAPAPAPAASIEWTGRVFVARGTREAVERIRSSAPEGITWRWHAGACNPKFCRAGCIAAGITGWWTPDAEAVRALRAIWAPSTVEEMSRREASSTLSRATDAEGEIPCPPGLAYLPFQRAGIQYARARRGALIADEMGLGKTVQAVGVVNCDTGARTILVVCPAFLRGVWQRHAERWSVRQTRVVTLEGATEVAKAKKTGALARRGDETLWIVISYSGARAASSVGKLVAEIESFDLMVLDECHRVKEYDAQQSQGVIALSKRARRVLALTGTPILNRPIEMATTLAILDPTFNFWTYAKRYCDAHQTRFGWDLTGSSNAAELQRKLRETVMIRRLKAQVLKELPLKTWDIVSLPTVGIPDHFLSSIGMRRRDAADRAQAARAIARAIGDMDTVRDTLEAEIAALKPDFDSSAAARSALGTYKVDATVQYLRTLPQDECVIVFAHHRHVARGLYAALGGAEHCVILDGDVDPADRVDEVDRFQSSEDTALRYVIATIESAKEGLTITRCSRVCFAEQAWTPGVMAQAEDRAHRIGQQRGVAVEYLVFDGSLDGYLCQLLAEKGRIAQEVLDTVHEYDDAQREVVFADKPREERTREFTAHEVGALAKRRRDATVARSLESRGVTAEYVPSRSQVVAMIACMASLAGMDDDRAKEDNGVGFSKSDVYVGHALAALEPEDVTPEIFALGAGLARKYRGQLGSDAVEAVLRRGEG